MTLSVQSVDMLTRCAAAKLGAKGRMLKGIRLHQPSSGYAGSGLQPRSILSQQIVALGLAIVRIGTISQTSPRAPRLLSVTESIVLPPRPRGGQMSNSSKFSVREWMVPPVLLPFFFVLLIAAAMLIQW
jgi:hypothetical protein